MPTDAPANTQVLGPKSGYRTLYNELQRRQKPGAGVPAYTRWPNRAIARALTPLAYRIGLTPNAVTVLSVLTSGIGMAVLILAERTIATGVIVAVLLAFGFALDSMDGQLARLSGKGGPAGEWLDHVADAIRTPALHLSVAVAFWNHGVAQEWLIVPLVFTVLSAGQFMSQILAEQLRKEWTTSASPRADSGIIQSWVLLPTDTGTTCWLFVLWGFTRGFEVAYALLCFVILAHTAVSMRRRYRQLRELHR